MATDSAVRSVSNSLTTTVADTVTITQAWPAISVTNADTTNDAWVRYDGTTAVALADNNTRVPAGTTVILAGSVNSSGQHVISIVGSGGGYTIEGVN